VITIVLSDLQTEVYLAVCDATCDGQRTFRGTFSAGNIPPNRVKHPLTFLARKGLVRVTVLSRDRQNGGNRLELQLLVRSTEVRAVRPKRQSRSMYLPSEREAREPPVIVHEARWDRHWRKAVGQARFDDHPAALRREPPFHPRMQAV
jgi:hypothetical protein